MDGQSPIASLHALFAAGAFAAARACAEALLADEPLHADALHVLGVISYRDGRFADAVVQLQRSLAIAPHANKYSDLGAALRANGQLVEAEAAYREALSRQPDLLNAIGNLANLLIATDRSAAAETLLRRAVQQRPTDPVLRQHLAGVLQHAGRRSAAVECWRELIALAPDDDAAVMSLVRSLYDNDQYTEAEGLLRRRIAANGNDASTHEWLGHVLRATGRWHEAEQAFTQCLAIAPGLATAWAARSDVLRQLGRMDAAEAAARQALAIDPRFADAAANLGNALGEQARHIEAEAAFDLALSLQADSVEALNGRGLARLRRGAPVAAAADFRRVLQLRPDLAAVAANLGAALLDQGEPVAALQAMRAACVDAADVGVVRRNILSCLNYQPDLPAEAIFAEYRAWGAAQQSPPTVPRSIDRATGRRLRIGYVSPDFRAQSASFFIRPLLAAHDRDRVELFCYAQLSRGDATTEQFQALADHWRETVELSDEALAAMIRRDRIDVLVDMGGYSTNSRLATFALKPAPVQIEYLLGHGSTSGLATMDVFLADAALVPPGFEPLFSERVVRLDRIPLAYAPVTNLPAVAPPPARTRGYLTFGHFGRPARLHAGVIAAWSRILNHVPNSRLMLNSPPFDEPAVRAKFADSFARHGVEAHRLELVYTQPHQQTLLAYGGIDIALDPFPHNAGTTTIEALWMGVPVVSLAGRPPLGRFGASVLHAVGLADWCATDLDAYVVRATRAATDPDGLACLRATLRDRCLASPLNDAIGLARDIEAVYRRLWQEAC